MNGQLGHGLVVPMKGWSAKTFKVRREQGNLAHGAYLVQGIHGKGEVSDEQMTWGRWVLGQTQICT
jgi:hypothetical protein